MHTSKPIFASIDPAQVRTIVALPGPRAVMSCRFAPGGNFLMAGDMGARLVQYAVAEATDPAQWTATALAGHQSWVAALAVAPDGTRLYTSDYSGRLCAWDFPAPAEAAPLWTQTAHQGWLRGLAVSADGALLATCGNDRVVRLWNAADGQLARELASHEDHVYSVAFHPAGDALVSADLLGVVKHWDVPTGMMARELDARAFFKIEGNLRLGGVRNMRFDAEGKLLLCGGMSGISGIGDGIGTASVLPIDWASGQPGKMLMADQNPRGFVVGAFWHPTGIVLAATGGLDQGMLLFWRPDEPKPFHQFRLPQSAWGADLHPDGRRLAVGDHNGTLTVYDLAPAG